VHFIGVSLGVKPSLFIGGSLGVKPSLCRLHKLCRTFYRLLGVSLGVKPSLCGLYKLCKAFYRRQFGCEAFARYEAFALRSVQALQGIL